MQVPRQTGFNLDHWLAEQVNLAKAVAPDLNEHMRVSRSSSSWLQNLSSEQKIHSGMQFLITGMCAMGAVSQLSQGFAKDENGERHIQPTHVGLGIVSALLAAGSAYIGTQTLRGR